MSSVWRGLAADIERTATPRGRTQVGCFSIEGLRLHERALRLAAELGHAKTYDAHYLALAKELRVELWTADRRLANGARTIGIDWVRWIGESG